MIINSITTRYCSIISIVLLHFFLFSNAQENKRLFKIRTITAGANLNDLSDTISILKAIDFLTKAKQEYISNGYEVQTLRIATQHLYLYTKGRSNEQIISFLKKIDKICTNNSITLSVGQLWPVDSYDPNVVNLASSIVKETTIISFSISISSQLKGIHHKGISLASEIIIAL